MTSGDKCTGPSNSIHHTQDSCFRARQGSIKKTKVKLLVRVLYIFLALYGVNAAFAQVTPRYNVLLIPIDDMNDRVDYLGWPEVATPNLQRLYNRGMRFTKAYVQYALCNPSRTSVLSGWRPDKTGIFSNTVRPRSVISPSVKFLPEYFRQYGYRTERYGKIMHGTYENDITWDYAEPPEILPERIRGEQFSDAGEAIFPAAVDTPGVWWVRNQNDSLNPDGREARNLVKRMQQPQQFPFFYGLGLISPHDFFIPNLPYWNMNGDPSVQEMLPMDVNGRTSPNFTGNGSANIILPNANEPPNDRSDVPYVAFNSWQLIKPEYELKRTIHAYNADVSMMDAQLGLVLDELDRQQLWSNTIVVFFGDHGQHLGEHEGTWRKQTLFEESLHVPLVICVPGKPAGVCSRLVELVDIYPTLIELCGLPPVPGIEGSGFARLFDNPAQPWKSAVFSQVQRAGGLMGRSVTSESYRYNNWSSFGEELYDHVTDPGEYTNLVTNPAYSSVLADMRKKYADGWTKSLPPPCDTLFYYTDADGDGYGSGTNAVRACYQPIGYVANNNDCNDAVAGINPGAAEICDGIDNNCNGETDEGVLLTYYQDADSDGFGNAAIVLQSCTPPVGYVSNNIDCDDSRATVYPGAEELCDGLDNNCNGETDEGVLLTYYQDADGDGFGNAAIVLQSCTPQAGYVSNNTDCDDSRATVYPGAEELCDGLDNNCNGETDEGGSFTYYQDADGDGFGNAAIVLQSCTPLAGYVSDNTDCDDNHATVYPGAEEVCDNLDNNCNGEVDEGFVAVMWYRDADGDGYGDAAQSVQTCLMPEGYIADNTDCDDSHATVYPGAEEVCDNLDNNCNGEVDEGFVAVMWYRDADGDGYGDAAQSVQTCLMPEGYIADNTDCDDSHATVYPGAEEVCDNLDNNCNGEVDEGFVAVIWYRDADGDGYGDAAQFVQSCLMPEGFVIENTDCDDGNNTIYPGAAEVCDGVDNNCDGTIDEGGSTIFYLDADNDGYGNAAQTIEACTAPEGYVSNSLDCDDGNSAIKPGATEVCDGVDNNCDGTIDEGVSTTFFLDSDNDGYGNAAQTIEACTAPEGYVTNSLDCDDGNSAINPGATEVCDGVDNNCDGTIDEGGSTIFYLDADKDGYGNAAQTIEACTAPEGYVSNSLDCDDGNSAIYPGATEVCDGVDNNCNGVTDETTLLASSVHGIIACVGGTTSVTVSATGGSGSYYGTGIFTAGAGNYQYTVTDSYGCSAITGGSIAAGTGTAPAIPGNITGQSYNLCGGGNYTYTVPSVSGATSYNWIIPPGFSLVQNNGRSAVIKVPATFSSAVISVSAVNGCGTSPARAVTVYAVGPNPSSSINGLSSVNAGRRNVTYQLPRVSGVTYTWTVPPGSTISSGQGTYRIRVNFGNTSGNITVVVSNACGSTPTGIKFVTVNSFVSAKEGVVAESPGAFAKVYPNPTNGIAQVIFSTVHPGSAYYFQLTDMNGKALLTTKGIALYGENRIPVDMSKLPAAMYIGKLVTSEKMYTLRITKSP